MMSVSGVFRKVVTQAPPKPRNTGTGETRIAANSTPSTNAITADVSVSRAIQKNPVAYTCRFAGSVRTFITLLGGSAGPRGGDGRALGAVRPSPGNQAQLVSLATSSCGAGWPLLPT